MTINDAPHFLGRLTILAELFDAKLSEAKQQIYFDALSDLEINDLVLAMQEGARYCKFMPKPLELREFACGKDEDHAEEGWLEFRSDMRRLGSYQGWDNPDTLLRSVVQDVFGGFSEACRVELTPEMWQARKKEFVRVYIAHARRESQRLALPEGSSRKLLS